MRRLIMLGTLLFFFCSTKGQTEKNITETPISFINDFQNYLYINPNPDSAFYFVKKLASNRKYATLLQQLIHNSFAQEFLEREPIDSSKIDSINQRKLFYKRVLTAMMTDTTELLSETVSPLFLWVTIQDKKNDLQAVAGLTNEFIEEDLSSSENTYKNSVERYALLIYQLVSKHHELCDLSDKLFRIIYSNLQNNQVRTTDSSTPMDLIKRAKYRYLFAYANYLRAKETADLNEKEKYLKLAFNFSPDLLDRNHYSAYFYDIVFLFKNEEKTSFKTDYIAFLASNTTNNKRSMLASLLEVALIDPETKNELQELYNSSNSTGISFEDYWMNAVNESAKTAPKIALFLLDGNLFSTEQLSGRWILVDFWGTWCAPCRAEHPAMQAFYDSVVLKYSADISLLTIACKDSNEKVSEYINENHFTFPVAMADNKIEDSFSVQGYPTKILITPKGKYVTVPFGIDWVNFVKQYSNLR